VPDLRISSRPLPLSAASPDALAAWTVALSAAVTGGIEAHAFQDLRQRCEHAPTWLNGRCRSASTASTCSAARGRRRWWRSR